MRHISFAVLLSLLLAAPVQADITSNLVGWWRLDEGTGTNAADSGSGGNAGTLTDGPTWGAGKVGPYSVTFDGSNDYISVTHAASIDMTTVMTIAAWIKTSTADRWIVEKRDSGQANGWTLNGNSDGTFGFAILNSPNNQIITSTSLINDGAWHHVVGVLSGGVVSLYFDAQSQGTPSGSATSAASHTGNMFFGKRVNDTDYHNGQLDDIRLYNRALSATDIKELYAYPRRGVSAIVFQ